MKKGSSPETNCMMAECPTRGRKTEFATGGGQALALEQEDRRQKRWEGKHTQEKVHLDQTQCQCSWLPMPRQLNKV